MPKVDVRRDVVRHQALGRAKVIDVVGKNAGEGTAFFALGPSFERISGGEGTTILNARSIGEAPVIEFAAKADPTFSLDGAEGPLKVAQPDRELFAGLNTALAFRTTEPVHLIQDWLAYHARSHGLQAALILDRSPPEDGPRFVKALRRGLDIEGLIRVVVVQLDIPIGRADLPPEAHPFNAPDAPGKSQMDIPAASPWESPLGELQIFEWLRHRYLGDARAVAQLDISDIVPPLDEGDTIFDRAVASESGSIALEGRHCYPWRVRKGDEAHFSDHTCVLFDSASTRNRWCVAPKHAGEDTTWRLVRVAGAEPAPEDRCQFYRCMAIRHADEAISKIAPKSSFVEDETLLKLSEVWGARKPVRMPQLELPEAEPVSNRTCIVTCMKNEGPFILEWIAYHQAIGVEDFLVYSNDCTDGTDTLLDLLAQKGIIQHRINPFRDVGMKPQHAALNAAEDEKIVQKADWLISMDVDEFINIKIGDGTLDSLYNELSDANMISLTWRNFGNSDFHDFREDYTIERFTRCAREFTPKPHQAWGFKTLYRNIGIFKKMGVHRPKGLRPQLWDNIQWVNGSGDPMPRSKFRNAWRSTKQTFGYEMVSLNHYAVRNAESYLVKRDRGRVNHVDRDQGLAYWFRMNNNATKDTSIKARIPMMDKAFKALLADPELAQQHRACIEAHKKKIVELRKSKDHSALYQAVTSKRMEKLSRMHHCFGSNVFLAGPQSVPDEIVWRDHNEKFFFTIQPTEAQH